jgi:hypothetical protein
MPAIGTRPDPAEGARGERDPGVAGDEPGVVVEALVEVTEPVEQDRVRVLALEIEVLPARRDQVWN